MNIFYHLFYLTCPQRVHVQIFRRITYPHARIVSCPCPTMLLNLSATPHHHYCATTPLPFMLPLSPLPPLLLSSTCCHHNIRSAIKIRKLIIYCFYLLNNFITCQISSQLSFFKFEFYQTAP